MRTDSIIIMLSKRSLSDNIWLLLLSPLRLATVIVFDYCAIPINKYLFCVTHVQFVVLRTSFFNTILILPDSPKRDGLTLQYLKKQLCAQWKSDFGEICILLGVDEMF